MKKALIGFSVIFMVGLMVYLTRPAKEPQLKNLDETGSSIPTKNPAQTDVRVSDSQPELAKCSPKSLSKALKSLKEERDNILKAFVGETISAEKLSQIVQVHLRDTMLAREINSKSKPEKAKLTPEEEAIKDFRKQEGKAEDIIMAAWAGQANEVLAKFSAGELSPLDPNSNTHKLYILNMLALGGEQQTVKAIDRLYSSDGTLDPTIAPAIIQSINDPKLLKTYLSRVTDLNAPVSNSSYYFSNMEAKPLIQYALQQQKFSSAEVLLELGVKPDNHLRVNSLDYFYQVDDSSYPLIEKLLNKGFSFSNSAKANRLANTLSKKNPDLAARVTSLANRIKSEETAQYANLPIEIKQVIDDFKAQHEPLNKKYIQCLAQEKTSKPKIPPYQPIDKKKIEQEIDLLIAQKVEYAQIIATLATQNKEAVEHGYSYLKRLRNKQNSHLNMMSMPTEVRTVIGLLKDSKWPELVEFMKTADYHKDWQLTPGTLLGAMLEKNAPESQILAMAKISDKNDINLLNEALHKEGFIERIANYGFNLNATDQSNKNLFYQAVRRNNLSQIDFLISQGINMVSDPYGYDALDVLLRKKRLNSDLLTKLNQVGFPLTEAHSDYSRYLRTYYPERYQKLIDSWPELQVEGQWQPKS